MTKSSQTSGNKAGFTLLEVLLAMTLFAIVVSVVYVSYSSTFTTSHHLEARLMMNNKARIVMERLTEDLESFYLANSGFLKGEKDKLQFTSTAHLVFSKDQLPAGSTTIEYHVVTAEDELLQLYRSDTPFRPQKEEQGQAEERGYLMCDGLKSVQFSYISREGETLDEWDSEEENDTEDKARNIPEVIQFTLTFPDPLDGEQPQVFRTGVHLPEMNVLSSR